MKKIDKIILFCLCLCIFCVAFTPIGAWASDMDGLATVESTSRRVLKPDEIPKDSQATTAHWHRARAYKARGRYELARQEYLLSLANCRTESTRDQVQRELQIVEMQLRTLR